MRYFVKTFLGVGIFAACLTSFCYALRELLITGTCASGGPYVVARECPEGTEVWVLTLFGSVIVGLIGAGIFAARGRPPGADDSSAARRGLSTALLLWSAFFCAVGAVALWTAVDPPAGLSPGGETAGFIIGPLFLLMGGVPAVIGALGWLANRGDKPATSAFSSSTLLSGRGGDNPLGGTSSATAQPNPFGGTSPSGGAQANPLGGSTVVHGPVRGASSGVRPAARPPAAGAADPLDQLRRLDELREKGVLSESEFLAAKAKILAKM